MEQLKKTFLSLALLLVSTIMYAQSEISGTVVDPTGETVIGATVMAVIVDHPSKFGTMLVHALCVTST